MIVGGLVFILWGRVLTGVTSNTPRIADLAAQCLFITAFAQPGFSAAVIFAGALRGAGDTFTIMWINLASVLFIRLAGVMIVGWWLHMGLAAIWIVLASELTIRGVAVFLRFRQGGWQHTKV
jgi:Na+-driven multidrug efflux pump